MQTPNKTLLQHINTQLNYFKKPRIKLNFLFQVAEIVMKVVGIDKKSQVF